MCIRDSLPTHNLVSDYNRHLPAKDNNEQGWTGNLAERGLQLQVRGEKMDCIQSRQQAIEYMEEHILEAINYEDVAKHVYIDVYKRQPDNHFDNEYYRPVSTSG